jgi:hypothetical protein
MKFIFDKLLKKGKEQESMEEEEIIAGNPELAKNKEIYSILTDPKFIKTFPGPADFQYDLLRDSLFFSKEDTKNGIAYLKNFLEKSENPIFCLIKFSQFLHTAFGNIESIPETKNTKDRMNTLKKGFKEISSGPNIKYFLGLNLTPEIVFSENKSFEKMEKGLTPIQISEGYFIQDNGFDPIPIFYYTNNPEEFNSKIEGQKRFFEKARPENRPDLPENANLKEMRVYMDEYLFNFNEKKSEIVEKIKNSVYKLTPKEIQVFFPKSHNTYELTQDPLMFDSGHLLILKYVPC